MKIYKLIIFLVIIVILPILGIIFMTKITNIWIGLFSGIYFVALGLFNVSLYLNKK